MTREEFNNLKMGDSVFYEPTEEVDTVLNFGSVPGLIVLAKHGYVHHNNCVVLKDIDLEKLDKKVDEVLEKETPESMKEFLEESRNKEMFEFASYLTGHDIETIKQMYEDWRKFK